MPESKSAFADDASNLTRLLSPEPEFDELVHRTLKPVSFALSVIFVVFVLLGIIDDSAGEARPLIMATDLAAAVFFALAFLVLRAGWIPVALTYPVGLVFASIPLANALLAFWLTGEGFFLAYLPMIAIGCSAFMLSLPWLLITFVIITAAGFVVATDILPVVTVLQYMPALAGGFPVAILVFLTRRWQVIASHRALLAMQAEAEERKRAEEHLAHAQRLESIGKLVSGIAHDFNNLLMVIVGYTDSLLQDAKKGSELHTDLGEIRGAGEKAAALAQKLLAFSRQQVMQPRVISINELVEGARTLIAKSLPADVRLELDLAADAGQVNVDPLQMEQVLINLALNARDAMSVSGGVLRISTRSFDAGDNRWVELSVRDTGCGMADDVKARIFEPFFTTKPRGAGTGLGLAMVYGIVRQSGGTIDIESAPGAGTTMRIRLAQVQAIAPPAANDTPVQPRHSLAGATVLVVDDEPSVRSIVSRTLKRYDCRVLEADSGQEALNIVARETFDIVVSDVVMPAMSGVELLKTLRSRGYTQPAILMSGHAAEKVTEAGGSDAPLLHKPFRADDLVDAIHDALALEAGGLREPTAGAIRSDPAS